ncbi:mixed-linked glucanase precursor [Paraphoma chrysanthemicola]|nr:mixed-linked glucanase precursor [Paraphoma chrysanthemicola]
MTNMFATTPTPMLAITFSLFMLSSAQNGGHDSGAYTLTDDLSYDNFFDNFDFFSGPDPTKGFVQYQNMTSAVDQGLVGYLEDTKSVFMGVDYMNKDPKGRASVRLESKNNFNHGLLVTDIRHMPASQCGSWPAFWMLGQENWPRGGEIDLVEGVNDYEHNVVTLHTSKGCIVDNTTSPNLGSSQADDFNASFTGTLTTDDCDVAAEDQDKNVGCSIKAPTSLSLVQMGTGASQEQVPLPSYGTEFNKAGGGIYAMEWTPSSISVWFFPHSSPLYKSTSNSTIPDPKQWGTPLAYFAGSGCDFEARFKDLRIIFNTAFCGEWAGKEWDKSCAQKTGVDTCDAYVRDNPEVFKDSYWEIKGLKWYQRKDFFLDISRRVAKAV